MVKKFTNTFNQEVRACGEVFLALEPSAKTSSIVNVEIAEKGFCIAVKTAGNTEASEIYPFSICKERKGIQLSSQYTAERISNDWKIAGQEFSETFIREMYNFLSKRGDTKIIVHAITFDLD